MADLLNLYKSRVYKEILYPEFGDFGISTNLNIIDFDSIYRYDKNMEQVPIKEVAVLVTEYPELEEQNIGLELSLNRKLLKPNSKEDYIGSAIIADKKIYYMVYDTLD